MTSTAHSVQSHAFISSPTWYFNSRQLVLVWQQVQLRRGVDRARVPVREEQGGPQAAARRVICNL